MISNACIFRPNPILMLIAMLLLGGFIGLGIWQLDRAEQKRELARSMVSGQALPPLRDLDLIKDADEFRFRRISLLGTFEPRYRILLENRRYRGRPGYHVITPFRLVEGGYILVNRGWIAVSPTWEPPGVETPPGTIEVNGHLVKMEMPPIRLGDDAAWAVDHWPYLDRQRLMDRSGLDLAPLLIRQDPKDPHGLVRDWPPFESNVLMHIGYAIQWFSFALITVIVYISLSTKKRRQEKEE